jgi:hypothetical protein
MLNIRPRVYLYIVIAVAGSITLLTDPDLLAASRIGDLFQSLAAACRNALSALR